MRILTDAIDEQGYFDPRYTCDVDNSSPELRWTDPPDGTAGFAVLAEDLDAPNGPFVHWVVYNIPATVLHLPTGIPPQDTLPNGIRQGLNGFNKLGYFGPCPPHGAQSHRYAFRIYALKAIPLIAQRATRDQLLRCIESVTLESAEVQGQYQRLLERTG